MVRHKFTENTIVYCARTRIQHAEKVLQEAEINQRAKQTVSQEAAKMEMAQEKRSRFQESSAELAHDDPAVARLSNVVANDFLDWVDRFALDDDGGDVLGAAADRVVVYDCGESFGAPWFYRRHDTTKAR